MDTIKLIIVEKDIEYGQALAKAISNLHNEFHVSLSSLESLKQSNLKPFAFILIGGYEENEMGEFSLETNVIWLTEEFCPELKETSCAGRDSIKRIYKYSKVSNIIANLRFAYSMVSGKREIMPSESGTKLIGFYSPSGGAGTTSVSISVARELSRYHDKKVLYLNLEEFSSSSFYMDDSSADRSISDFLYYVLEKKINGLCTYADGFTFQDLYGVEAFRHEGGLNELRQLSRDEIDGLFRALTGCRRYDFIILDLGHSINDAISASISYCSIVAVVFSDHVIQRHKCEIFTRYLMEKELAKEEKMIFIRNRAEFIREIEHRDETLTDCVKSEIPIEDDPNSFCFHNKSMTVSIDHIFGIGVKKIADEIVGANF